MHGKWLHLLTHILLLFNFHHDKINDGSDLDSLGDEHKFNQICHSTIIFKGWNGYKTSIGFDHNTILTIDVIHNTYAGILWWSITLIGV